LAARLGGNRKNEANTGEKLRFLPLASPHCAVRTPRPQEPAVNRAFAFLGLFMILPQFDGTKPISAKNCDFSPESCPPSRELKTAEQSQSRRLPFSETGKAGGEHETAEQSQFAPRTTGALRPAPLRRLLYLNASRKSRTKEDQLGELSASAAAPPHEEVVRAGKYQNASEAMRDALRGLQQRLKTDELKLDLLRVQVKAGLDALERGAFTEVGDADLDATLDGLVATGAR
jgi:antitoxin ParD1/3/4